MLTILDKQIVVLVISVELIDIWANLSWRGRLSHHCLKNISTAPVKKLLI